jgi:hypothetical protein
LGFAYEAVPPRLVWRLSGVRTQPAADLVVSVVGRLHFDRQDISAVLEEPTVVVPVDPFASSKLDSSQGFQGVINSVL